MRLHRYTSRAGFVLAVLLATLVSPAASEPLFEEWVTASVYEHSATGYTIIIVHREFADVQSAQERIANTDRLMTALLGENAHQIDLSDDVQQMCALYSGEYAEFGEELREAWAIECLSDNDTFLMIVDESLAAAIGLAEAFVENGEPVIPEGYQLVTSPLDYPGSRTIRGVWLAEDRPVFQEVDLQLIHEDGNFLEIRVEEATDLRSLYTLELYDPEDVDLGEGVTFERENQNPVRVCRQFTYQTSDGNLYTAVCSHGAWILYVVGSDEGAVEFAATAFSEDGTEEYVPEGYIPQD